MRFVGNIIYLLTGGIVLSLGWLGAALIFWLLVATRPLARTCLQLAGLCLWPGGRDVIRARQAETYRTYIRTGQRAGGGDLTLGKAAVRCAELLLWLPVGILLTCGHFLHAGLMVFPIMTNGLARQDIGLAGIALFPFGAGVASAGRAQITRHALRGQCARERKQCWMLAARSLTAVSAAAFSLWVPSDNQAQSPPPPLRATWSAPRGWGGASDQLGLAFTNFDVASGRLQAGPPLATAEAAASVPPLAPADNCVRSEAVSFARLSRRTSGTGAQPLGSRRIASRWGLLRPQSVRLVENIGRMTSDASWHAKSPADTLCRSAMLRRVAQLGRSPVSRRTLAALVLIERTGSAGPQAAKQAVGRFTVEEEGSGAQRPRLPATVANAASTLTIH